MIDATRGDQDLSADEIEGQCTVLADRTNAMHGDEAIVWDLSFEALVRIFELRQDVLGGESIPPVLADMRRHEVASGIEDRNCMRQPEPQQGEKE